METCRTCLAHFFILPFLKLESSCRTENYNHDSEIRNEAQSVMDSYLKNKRITLPLPLPFTYPITTCLFFIPSYHQILNFYIYPLLEMNDKT